MRAHSLLRNKSSPNYKYVGEKTMEFSTNHLGGRAGGHTLRNASTPFVGS